ncbi:MAG TPA: carbamoyltransferase C-terminal domain-containing protein [Candidatus Aquilonibacter sp.]|nr:carbamoyltransferase C-terminal domain-containing protein [Candidatus Aquilonibacter sp.]
MRILGLSSFTHDQSAALLEDGVIRAVVEESKLSRQKNTRGLPMSAIHFCLQRAGGGWANVDRIAIATTPVRGWMRRSAASARIAPLNLAAVGYAQAGELGRIARELAQFRVLRHQQDASDGKFIHISHHLGHAASAFFLSPFERALVLIMDEDGDGHSGMIALGEGSRLRKLRDFPYPHSLAWLFSQATGILGFQPHADEHKTQWLGLGVEPLYRDVFRAMLGKSGPGSLRFDSSYLQHGIGGRFALSSRFWQETGLPRNSAELTDEQRRGLAATVQQVCAEKVGEMIETLRREHRIQDVCLAGGLFNNTLLVSALEQSAGLDHVFVPPAPGNSGTALGAALYLHHQVNAQPRKPLSLDTYWGPSYSRHEIKDVLDNCKARFSFQVMRERQTDQAVQLLLAGKIVGWFQGAAEFGPRALGNRSVLASPWAPYVKENLNDFIKHREWFRPFAISVPEEEAQRYFECSRLCEFMNSLAHVRPGAEELLSAFTLPGGLVRLHVVRKETNLPLWDLLQRFGQQAPAPMLLNTSFNLFGEPLVVSPLDAIRSYSCSGVDALLMDNFLLSKAPLPSTRPAASDSFSVPSSTPPVTA